MSAKQAAFLVLDQQEAFFGGAAGPGKSDALFAAALQYVDVPGYAAVIFRRTYTDLSLPGALMARSQEWLGGRPDTHWDEQRKTWTFPSGATITFAYLQHEEDKLRYKSAEFTFIGFDELTQFSSSQYEYLFSRLRAVSAVKAPLRMRSASNPGDVGHGWVKRRFVSDRAPGVIWIPARLDDHPDERFKDDYRASLGKLDEYTRRMYEEGDWDSAAGLAFRLNRELHLIPPTALPDQYERFEALDFGVANPTCVLAFAVDYDGNLIVHDSYYEKDTLVSEHATAIRQLRRKWWPREQTPICHADPSMWARTGGISRFGDPATDVSEFEDAGLGGLVRGNNRRRPGRIRVAELLNPDPNRPFPAWHPHAGERGSPRLFIVADRCPELVEQIADAPLLPLESGREGAGEIVDPAWESSDGHAVAALRYGVMSRPDASSEPDEEPDDYRRYRQQQLLADYEHRLTGKRRFDRKRYSLS